MDREKVIAGLTMLVDRKNDNTCEGLKCCKIAEDAISLLKEQEAMKPISKSRHGANPQVQHFCRRCNAMLFHHKQKYCIECGQAVKWE